MIFVKSWLSFSQFAFQNTSIRNKMAITRELTRRDSTIENYLKEAEAIRKRIRKITKMNEKDFLDPRLLVGWLDEHRVNISTSTWRHYKSSCLCALELELQNMNEKKEMMPWISAIECLKIIDCDGRASKVIRGAAKKLKKFPDEDFELVYKELNGDAGEISQALLDWLRAGIWLGLRPSEWKDAELIEIEGIKSIVVQNAKLGNGRAHGKTRTLVMSKMNEEEIAIVLRHLERTKKWESAGIYRKMNQSCASKLQYTVRKIWPKRRKHLTLYSARHQFVADAKSSGISLSEMAALMGHSVDNTATIHYGRRAAAQRTIKIESIQEEILRIKQVFHERNLKNPFRKKNSLTEIFEKDNNELLQGKEKSNQ